MKPYKNLLYTVFSAQAVNGEHKATSEIVQLGTFKQEGALTRLGKANTGLALKTWLDNSSGLRYVS